MRKKITIVGRHIYSRQYLTIGVNGLVEAAEFLGVEINDNPRYALFVQEVLGLI